MQQNAKLCVGAWLCRTRCRNLPKFQRIIKLPRMGGATILPRCFLPCRTNFKKNSCILEKNRYNNIDNTMLQGVGTVR